MIRSCMFVSAVALSAPFACAGDMKAALKSGVLTITDSSADDDYTIDQIALPDTSYRLTPGAGTTINGSAVAQLFSNVTLDVKLKHGEGTDQATLDDLVIARDLVVTATGGIQIAVTMTNGLDVGRDLRVDAKSDQFVLNSTGTGNIVRRDAKFSLKGTNGNSLGFLPLNVLGNTTVKGSNGTELIIVGNGVQFVGNFTFDGVAGGDTYVDTATSVVGGAFKARGKAGTQVFILVGKYSGDVTAECGNGDGNNVQITATQIGGDVRAKFGKGNNNVFSITGTTVTGDIECTSKGSGDTAVVSNVTTGGDVRVKLGAGTNLMSGGAASEIGGDVQFTGGAGHDQFGFSTSTILGDVRVDLGAAPTGFTDMVTMINGFVGDDVVVNGGAGVNSVGIEDVTVMGQVKTNLGAGGSSFILDGGTYGEIFAAAGAGDDTVTLTGGVLKTVGDIRVVLGAGTNQVPISHTTCGRDLIIRTGGGDDTVSIATTTIVGTQDIDLGGGMNSGP